MFPMRERSPKFKKPLLFFFCLFFALPATVRAAQSPLRAVGFAASDLVSGKYWGWPPKKAADVLGLEAGEIGEGAHPDYFVAAALERLWKTGKGERFRYVRVSSDSVFLEYKKQLSGYVLKVPVEQWEDYEVAVRKVFGAPRKIHFTVKASTAAGAPEKFFHIYRWEKDATQFLFLKPTQEDNSEVWLNRDIETIGRVRIMQKMDAGDVPLYLGVFDSKRLKDPEGFYHEHAGKGLHFHEAGHSHDKKKSGPGYIVPLTPGR